MNNARITYPEIFKNKTKIEIKNIIENNIFNENKKDIAIKYYVYEECMIDIGMEYDLSRKSISKTLNKIVRELERVA